MSLQNPWVSYVTRSYAQIKQSLLTQMVTNNPEITDHSESNILVIIISMFAGLSEMLGYYIDNMAREAFIATARRFPSMVKLVKLLDYRIKAAYPGTADILFTFNNPLTSSGVIVAGTILQTANNVPFVTIANLAIPLGATAATIGVRQVTPVVNANLGTTNGTPNQAFAIGTNYVDSTSTLTVSAVIWNRVTTLGLASPTDQVYIIEIDIDGIAYAVFGDGVNGQIPATSSTILMSYDSTLGVAGNVDPNTITTIVSTITLPGVTNITVTNPLAASGGSAYEDIESIRINAPLSIRTLDRAVTKQDYIDVTLLAPGVGKADVDFECGKTIDIYIVPVGGGIAQSPLLISAGAFVDNRRMVTTFINMRPAGETPLAMIMDVYTKYRANTTQALLDVQNVLVDYGSYAKQNINRAVNLSDIVALVDNLDRVDHVDLNGIFTRPYARPDGHQTDLVWTRDTQPACITKSNWILEWTGTQFLIIRNFQFQGAVSIGTLWTDPSGDITFTFLPGAYQGGQSWEFVTYPYGKNIPLDDFSIPKVFLQDLSINIIPILVPNN